MTLSRGCRTVVRVVLTTTNSDREICSNVDIGGVLIKLYVNIKDKNYILFIMASTTISY